MKSHFKRRLLAATILGTLLYGGVPSVAQTVDLQFAPAQLKQVGPSPQAASMTRYADASVSYGLGLAQVSIPLYEIKSRSLSLPISLSYDSSGVRVDAVSGPVGLNWTLAAGGAITRTVMGYPDEAYNGWNDSWTEYQYDLTQNNDYSTNVLDNISKGELDPGRDRFFFNFCGYSGSFYLVDGVAVPTTATDLSISGSAYGGFIITDPAGTKYYFTEAETSSSSTSMTLPIFGAGSGSAENYPSFMVPVTAWYLTRIESMDGKDRIDLTYETTQNPMISEIHSYVTSYSFTYKYQSAGSLSWLGENGQWWSAAPAVSAQLGGYKTLRGWTPHLLSRIEWTGGKITFEYAASPVNENSNVRRSYPKVLTRMDVWSVPVGTSNSTLIRRAAFTQGNTSDKRTLLKTVFLNSGDGALIESYALTYIGEDTTNMDPRMKDLFGYYNGKFSNNYTDFLRLFPNENLLNVAPSDRSYNSSAVSALSLETVTTASGSRTKYFYEGNSVSGGSNALFSQIGVGHRISKIWTYDRSGGTEALVRERTFSYYNPHITIPTSVFDRSSFVNVTEVFREDLVDGEGSWSAGGGTRLMMPRTCYVSFADQSVLPGVPLEEAKILYGKVSEQVTDPASGVGFLTEYYYDMSHYEHGHSYGQWYLTWDHDQHDDHHDAPGYHLYHFFQRSPWIIPRENFNSGYSLEFIPRWFHYEPEDFPQMASPVEVRSYKRPAGTNADVLVSKTVNGYSVKRDTVLVGWRVRNMIVKGDEQYVKDTTCYMDFFVEKMYHNRVYRRLDSTLQTEYLDDGETQKTVRTDYYYEPGTRLSLTSVTAYSATVHTTPDSIPPAGSILSPRLTVQTVGVGENSPRQYARYSIFPDELSGLPGCGWADALLAAGYRSPVGEEVLVGGTLPSAPATKSGRYVTWGTFTPADTGSGSLLKPSEIEIWRQEEGSGSSYENIGPTIQYHAYDHWGNPLEVRQYDPQDSQDQQIVTYLWSYGGLRPIAEIEGIGYSDMLDALTSPQQQTLDGIVQSQSLSSAQLSFLRTTLRSAVPDAMISVFTYDGPEFAMSSAEDPSGRKTSYEYDGAGRLKGVRDEDGNLMESHLYELTRGDGGNPNRITSLTYTAAGATTVPTSFSAAMNASDAIKEVAYLDGLGRTVQGVSVGAATNGKDLVTPFTPDFLDREDAKVWLPYPATTSTSNAGSYRSGALSAQQSYFTGLYGSTEGARAYSENVYELSARGRVTATSLPGFTDRTVLSTAGSPGGHLPVLTFDPVTQTLSASGYYPQGYFTVSATAGPDGSLSESWADEFGTPVLERVRIREATVGEPEDEWAETRYIKDLRGRVLCIIPPAEYDQLLTAAAGNNGIVPSFSAEHCYTYAYDGRDRVVTRHLPDRATEQLSYNNADLVTSTVRTAADGIGAETFTTAYDGFYRPTEETYQYGSGTVITLAEYAYDAYGSSLGGLAVPAFSAVSGIAETADRDSRVKGLKTAERIRVISPDETPANMTTDADAQFIVRSFHYDKKDNVIQTVEKRPDVNAAVRTSTKYGFAGNVLQSKETVDIPAYGGGTAIAGGLNKAFTYDALLRPTGETTQLTSGGSSGPQGKLNYTYDDLGREATVKRNNSNAETTTYTYTLQGWLQNASSPDYQETLRYANPVKGATNALPGKVGLITEWVTQQKGTTANGGASVFDTYTYSYDGAGRLTGSIRYSGDSTTPLATLTEKDITYDKSGNLTGLKRYGSSSGTVPTDNLSFTYTGTKRTGYTYDAHGNVTADPTNGTTIQWNDIGLPKSISDGTDTARRVYAADGTLLAVYEGSTGTAGRIYAGSMVLTRDAGNVLSMESAGWEGGRILPGTGSDKLIYQIADHLGSVRVIKDGAGNVRQRFDYYPFGSDSRVWTAGTNMPQSAFRYRFGGKEIAGQKVNLTAGAPAAAAGSPYLDYGARLYDPRTAAWLAQDPLSEKYYGISPYAYCAGNPVNLVDPSGLIPKPLFAPVLPILYEAFKASVLVAAGYSGAKAFKIAIDNSRIKESSYNPGWDWQRHRERDSQAEEAEIARKHQESINNNMGDPNNNDDKNNFNFRGGSRSLGIALGFLALSQTEPGQMIITFIRDWLCLDDNGENNNTAPTSINEPLELKDNNFAEYLERIKQIRINEQD